MNERNRGSIYMLRAHEPLSRMFVRLSHAEEQLLTAAQKVLLK